ncbi:MAG: TnpV protein [Oscillospiraceae bacterium]|nr:TnpV protein [Oscillospiraceae bacterium]
MKKILHGDNEIDYTLCGDYYWPNLLPAQEDEQKIGIYGQRHFRYIKEHNKILCINLLTTGKLTDYLTEIDERAQNMKNKIIEHLAEKENVNSMLKEKNQMEWVRRMNNIRNRAEEIINKEIIFR